MGWYGKLIGGTIGIFLGGPLGAVLGAVIGHSFDARTDAGSRDQGFFGRERGFQSFSGGDQAQMVFFVATFSMLGKMANADGKITDPEIKTIERFIDQNLRLEYTEKSFAMRIVHTAAVSSEPFEKFASQFYSMFQGQPQIISMMFNILMQVASADSIVTKEEQTILDTVARIFRISQSQYENTKTQYHGNETAKNYSILDCKPTDSNDVIKSAYKKLIKDFHPDVIASKGLPEEFTKFAADKFTKISQAYEEIKKERNFK